MTNYLTVVCFVTWLTNTSFHVSGRWATNEVLRVQITPNQTGIGPSAFTNNVPVATNYYFVELTPVEQFNKLPRTPLRISDDEAPRRIYPPGTWRPAHTFKPKWKQ